MLNCVYAEVEVYMNNWNDQLTMEWISKEAITVFLLTIWLLNSFPVESEEPAPSEASKPTPYQIEKIPDGYSVETIPIPDHIPLEVGGFSFAPDGEVYICTRWGDVWSYGNRNGEQGWNLFAEGLQEPLGIWVDPDAKQQTVYVVQRPELTRIVDTTGNGWGDQYETVSANWGLSQNYHEYAYGLPKEKGGPFYITLNLGTATTDHSLDIKRGVHDTSMIYSAHDRGTAVQITSDGTYNIFAYGFRSPAGLALHPDNNELFVTDNQGGWVPTSCLYHVQKGRFYGHPASLQAHPEFEGKSVEELNEMSVSTFEENRTRPAIWFPHGKVASSPGEPIFNTDNHEFGPFEDQMFVGDQNLANVSRVSLEKIKGVYQGVVFEFARHFQSGILRGGFDKKGRLWLGQTNRGWGSVGSKSYGLQRIVYDGETTPFEMYTIRAKHDGFEIKFTKPVKREAASDPAAYDIDHWRYHYHPKYGSDRIDTTSVKPRAVHLSDDGKRVRLELPEMVPERVYGFRVDVPSAQGDSMSTSKGYYTLNRIPNE